LGIQQTHFWKGHGTSSLS
ncbi:mCG146546, partial [Mus musculus]